MFECSLLILLCYSEDGAGGYSINTFLGARVGWRGLGGGGGGGSLDDDCTHFVMPFISEVDLRANIFRLR